MKEQERTTDDFVYYGGGSHGAAWQHGELQAGDAAIQDDEAADVQQGLSVCRLSDSFALSACRLNVGNDYAKYVEFMHLVNCDAYVPTEAGFNLLVKIIYGLSGFENLSAGLCGVCVCHDRDLSVWHV